MGRAESKYLILTRYLTTMFLCCFCCFYSVNICLGENNNNQIELNYLFKPGCLKCIKMEKQLTDLKEKYPFLTINQYNVTDTDKLQTIISLLEKYSVPESQGFLTPTILIDNQYYIKKNINIKNIEQIIKQHSSRPLSLGNQSKLGTAVASKRIIATENKKFTERIFRKLNSFSYLTVLIAGLIDGINPCAFALLIFFLSYLKIAGRTKKQMIEVGMAYSISMFITYFLIGLGFFHGLKMVIEEYSYIAVGMYIFSGALALLCAGLSFWDIYLLYNRKNIPNTFSKTSSVHSNSKQFQHKKLILQLDEKTKKLTHKLIRNNSRSAYAVVGAVIIAVGVSFLELGCTGQIYLPVISFILQQKIIFSKALGLLIIYNLKK